MARNWGQIAPEKINDGDQSVKILSYCSCFNQYRKKISFEVQLSELLTVDRHLPVGRGLSTIIRSNSKKFKAFSKIADNHTV